MKTLNRLSVAVVVLSTAGLVSAGWKSAEQEGDFDDPTKWDEGYVPAYDQTSQADNFFLSGTDPYLIRLRDYAAKPSELAVRFMKDGVLTFDGEGAVFTMPAVSGADPAIRKSGDWAKPVFRTFFADANYQQKNYFTVTPPNDDVFCDILSWSNACLTVRQQAPESSGSGRAALEFTRGSFDFATPNGTDSSKLVQMSTDESFLSVTGLFDHVDVTMPRFTFSGYATQGDLLINGGRFAVRGDFNFNYSASAAVATNRWRVADGAEVVVGTSEQAVSMQVGREAYPHRRNEVVVTGAGTVLDATRTTSCAFNGNTQVFFENGSVSQFKRLQLGLGAASSADDHVSVRLSGADTQLRIAAGGQAEVAYNGTASFDLEDGTLTGADDATAWNLYLGYGNAGSGTVNLKGGCLRIASGGVYVGYTGSGLLAVSGGSHSIGGTLFLGGGDPGSKVITATYRQTGGTVSVGDVYGCASVNTAQRTSSVELTGGILRTGRVHGGYTVKVGKLGRSYFTANDSTINFNAKTVSADYPSFCEFDTAEIGSAGLTLDVDVKAIIDQDFVNAAGASGVIRVKGAGETVFKSKALDVSELCVEGGRVTLDAGVGKWNALIDVREGGTLSLSAVSGLSLDGGLRLGQDGRATLIVSAGSAATVKSVEIGDLHLGLSGAFPVGTYTLLTATNAVSAATKAAWTRALIRSGRAANTCYAFTTADGATAGSTEFRLVVSSAYDPVVTDASSLPYEESGSQRTVTVDDTLLLGALAFTDSFDYLIEGAGTLCFVDSGNAKLTGNAQSHEIAVKTTLQGQLTVDVPTGGTVTMSETVEGVGIRKIGDGKLVLAGADSRLYSGLVFEKGTLEIASSAVLADPSGAPDFTVTSPGQFRFGGSPDDPETVLPYKLYLSCYMWGQPVPVRTDAPLVVQGLRSDLSAGSCIVKYGVAPLVIETAKDLSVRLSQVNGTLGDAANVPTQALTVPASGVLGYSNKDHGGLNVLEGELRLRGTGVGTVSASSQAFNLNEAVEPFKVADRPLFAGVS